MTTQNEIQRLLTRIGRLEAEDLKVEETIAAIRKEGGRVTVLVNAGPSSTVMVSKDTAVALLRDHLAAMRDEAIEAGRRIVTLTAARVDSLSAKGVPIERVG